MLMEVDHDDPHKCGAGRFHKDEKKRMDDDDVPLKIEPFVHTSKPYLEIPHVDFPQAKAAKVLETSPPNLVIEEVWWRFRTPN